MGLAAQQARLLTITARKSDCEYQSMKLSHQKLAISRELEDVSNEYQNSLNQTKLMYDFYGNGQGEQLNYATLMTPSALNDYMPITITNSAGRVILNSQYAAAARAAGIPMEGLGCAPSTLVRQQFYNGLASAGLISQSDADYYASTVYNQALGLGETTSEGIITVESGDMTDLKAKLTGVTLSMNQEMTVVTGQNADGTYQTTTSTYTDITNSTMDSISLSQLLSTDPNDQVNYVAVTNDDNNYPTKWVLGLALDMTSTGGFIDQLYNAFASVLTTGYEKSTIALNYAKQKTTELFEFSYGGDHGNGQTSVKNGGDQENPDGIDNIATNTGYRPKKGKEGEMKQNILDNTGNIVGISFNSYWKGGKKGKDYNSACGVNLNNIARAFLTYFLDAYEDGLDTDDNKNDSSELKRGYTTSELITDDVTFDFAGETITSETAGRHIQFYDTLLNQIATSGWAENNQVTDPAYLQQMLQNGMMYITKIKDDGYYYQGNYATDSYVKEVTYETAIAQAEAKYNTLKTKLNSKENTLDLKMKNLDTEISSLTTEYDTIKNTISKNIERSFKRYSA